MGRPPDTAQKPSTAHRGATLARPPLGKLYAALTSLLLLIVAGIWWLNGTTAYSVLLGGLISVGPSYYFARQAFRFRGARFARHIAQAFYVGETGKFLLTAIAFALVFALVKPLHPAALLLAYIGMTVSHWALSAWIGARTGWQR